MSDNEPIKIETGTMAGPGAPIRVGKRLPGVSIGQARDMLLGKDVPEEIVSVAAAASEMAHPDLTGHVPQIGALMSPEGAWGVFCARCSVEHSDYVYPCKIDPADWPPQVLVAFQQAPQVTPE